MMNNVMLVGRLVNKPDLFSTENGSKGAFITLAVNRPYKNQDGEYETDFLDCTLWTGIAESTAEYCKKGDTIGIRGKLQSRIIENDDGSKYKKMEVIAERVSFISSKPVGDSKFIEHIESDENESEKYINETYINKTNDASRDCNKNYEIKNSKKKK